MDIKSWFELKLDAALDGDVGLEVSLNRFVLHSWEIEKLVTWTKPTAAVFPSPLGLKVCERCSNWSKVHPFSHPVISGVTSSIK